MVWLGYEEVQSKMEGGVCFQRIALVQHSNLFWGNIETIPRIAFPLAEGIVIVVVDMRSWVEGHVINIDIVVENVIRNRSGRLECPVCSVGKRMIASLQGAVQAESNTTRSGQRVVKNQRVVVPVNTVNESEVVCVRSALNGDGVECMKRVFDIVGVTNISNNDVCKILS